MKKFVVYTLYQILLARHQIKLMIWTGHVACVEDMKISYKILTGKLKGRYDVRKDNTKIDSNMM